MKYCKYCGEKLRDESKFCYRCGQPCGDSFSAAEEELPHSAEPAGGEAPEKMIFGAELNISEAFDEEHAGDGIPEDGNPGSVFPDDESPDKAFPDKAFPDKVSPDEEVPDEEVPDEDLGDDGDLRGDISDYQPEESFAEDVGYGGISGDDYPDPEPDDDDDPYYEEYGKKSRAGLIAVIVILAALAAYAVWSPARRAFMAAAAGQTDAAEEIYQSEVAAKPVEKVLLNLLAPFGVDYAFNSYNKGNIYYEDAAARIETLGSIGNVNGISMRRLNQLETLYYSKVAFLSGDSAREKGETVKALLAYRKVVKEDTNYSAAAELADQMEEQYVAEVTEAAGTPSTDEEYRAAISLYEEASTYLPDNQTIRDGLSRIRLSYAAMLKENAMDTGSAYIEEGFYKEAIDLADDALMYNTQDTDLISLRNRAVQKYEDFVTEQIDIYLENKDLKGAAALLEKASGDLPDSQEVAKLYEKVRAA